MTQTTTEVLGRAAVEAHSQERGEPDWLLADRLAAWERYAALPVPTTRDDGWRRTDLRELDLERSAAAGPAGEPATAPPVGASGEQAGLLVLHNGRVVRQELDAALARRGVLLLGLGQAARERPELVRAALAGGSRSDESKLEALAAALWGEGALLYLPRGVELEAPIQIVHWDDGAAPGLSRTLVLAEEASSAAVVESFGSPAGRPEAVNSGLAGVTLRQAARLTYCYLQERDEQGWSFASLASDQERDSALTCLLLGLGARTSRVGLTCNLNGQGAEADLLGVVFGDGRQHFDLQSLQNHVGDDTRSDLLLQVALRDRASSNFTGMIRVGQTALRTASNQVNHNLLLSGEAKADSDPKLEILNSDVTRCGHGASVGPVDQELIFYLQTRGLTKQQAERLVIEGFFAPLLEQVPIESVRERLWTAVYQKAEK